MLSAAGVSPGQCLLPSQQQSGAWTVRCHEMLETARGEKPWAVQKMMQFWKFHKLKHRVSGSMLYWLQLSTLDIRNDIKIPQKKLRLQYNTMLWSICLTAFLFIFFLRIWNMCGVAILLGTFKKHLNTPRLTPTWDSERKEERGEDTSEQLCHFMCYVGQS